MGEHMQVCNLQWQVGVYEQTSTRENSTTLCTVVFGYSLADAKSELTFTKL